MKHGENGLVFKDAEELATQLQVVGRLPRGVGGFNPALVLLPPQGQLWWDSGM